MSSINKAEKTDVELVLRTLKGDKEAYGELVARYQGHVYGLTYSIVDNWADAQDIAQETFIRAYCNLDQLRAPARFAAWLRRVTFSVAMNWLKAFRPGLFEQFGSLEDLDSLDIPDFAPGPAEVAEKRELADAVLRAVASLPPKYRVPLTMFHLDGLSYQKVADFLDIPLGTVQSLIHRARKMLRPALSAYSPYVIKEVSSMVQEVFNEHRLPPEFSRKVIEGVPSEEIVTSTWYLDGLPAAMRAALKFKGVEEKYLDDVVFAAITGQPFRFWFSPYWSSCLAYTYEDPLGVVVAEVLGFDYNWHPGGDGGANWEELAERKNTLDKKVVAAAWEELVREIEAGNPVIMFGGEPKVEPKAGPVIVTGYDAQRQLIYFVPASDWRPAPKWDDADPECKNGIKEQDYRARKRPDETNWVGTGYAPGQGMGGATISFFAFRKRTHKPTEHEVATAIIKRAIGFARGKLRDNLRPDRRPGLEAFELLIQCLDQDGEQFEYEDRKMLWTAIGKEHWWYAMDCFGGAGHFRKAASAFLRRCADGFGSFSTEQKKHIGLAAKYYDESDAHMGTFWNLFESVGLLGDYENDKQTVAKALSSRECRKQATHIVREIWQAEENAISALEKVLWKKH